MVLFFDKGAPTRKVWYYQLNPGRNMGKTNPLTPLRKHRIQMALKDLTGILEILLGVRLCGRYAFKGFVEDGDL